MTHDAHSIAADFAGFTFTQAIVLGLVQGVSELLPISSSAHMRIVPAVFGWRDPGAPFSAVLQLAALVAILFYFSRDFYSIGQGALAAIRQRDMQNPNLRLAVGAVIATAPIAVLGLALSRVLEQPQSPLRAIWVVGGACLGVAILLGAAEIFGKRRRQLEDARFIDFILLGLAQAGALIPGVSRSGATLAAGLALGFRREEAARVSFVLGAPAIALAGAKELATLVFAHLSVHAWAVLAVASVVATLASLGAIWGLMRVLERVSSWPFIVYRGALGAGLLIAAAMGVLT